MELPNVINVGNRRNERTTDKGTCGSVSWILDEETWVLTFSGQGKITQNCYRPDDPYTSSMCPREFGRVTDVKLGHESKKASIFESTLYSITTVKHLNHAVGWQRSISRLP